MSGIFWINEFSNSITNLQATLSKIQEAKREFEFNLEERKKLRENKVPNKSLFF